MGASLVLSLMVVAGWAAPATAGQGGNNSDGWYTSFVGHWSDAKQYMKWNVNQHKIRIWVRFGGPSGGTGNRCTDAVVDWNTNGTGHYDARVVRNCNPGGFIETDPGGDGFWQDPADFDEADVRRVQRVGSYDFTDHDLSHIRNDKNRYGGPPDRALPSSSWSQRIRTLYDNGTVFSHYHGPVRCAGRQSWQGYPGSSGGFCY